MQPDKILQAYNLIASQDSATLEGYLRWLVIDSQPPQRLHTIIAPWQFKIYDLLTPVIEGACGVKSYNGPRSVFIVAPRGHSKTSTIAQVINWALVYSKKSISITAAASDKDQARILLQRMVAEAHHNPHVSARIKFNNYTATGPQGFLDVISSDAPSSSGKLDDLLILDEISFWKKRDLFDVLLSGKAKRKTSALVIITNAGVQGSWQHDTWMEAKQSPSWIAHEVPPYSAEWMSKDDIEEQRKLLLPAIFKRMHLNTWTSPTDDAEYVSRQQIEDCVSENLNYKEEDHERTHKHIASIDVGLVNDRTVLTVVHMEGDNVILDKMDCWQGKPDAPVSLAAIERWLVDVIKNFNLCHLVLDPYELQHLAQKYERRVSLERFSFQGGSHYRLAENLRQLIINKRLAIYKEAGRLILPDGTGEDLVDEVSSLIVEERQGGLTYRLNHQPHLHDDRVISLALACLSAVRLKSLASPTVMLDGMVGKKKTEEEMNYNQIKYYNAYGTWQVCPVINGQEVRLHDYKSKHEAAYAINCVCDIYGQPHLNAFSHEFLPPPEKQKLINVEVVDALKERRLLPSAPLKGIGSAEALGTPSLVAEAPKKNKKEQVKS